MKEIFKKNTALIVVLFFIAAYAIYFSFFTILRYKTLFASYFDLGIMQQTVFNTFKALQSHDASRLLELTNPYGSEQIKRMVIHNDILLAFIAPFYFIYSGPEMLLIIQSVVLAAGAYAVFRIGELVFKKGSFLAVLFSFAYLFFTPMQRANDFDFHAVVLSTSFLIFMYYFWLKGNYKRSAIFFVLSLLSKEEVGLTTFVFGLYVILQNQGVISFSSLRHPWELVKQSFKKKESFYFGLTMIVVSLIWFVLSIQVIIPHFRGGHHFALDYYSDFGDSPSKVIFGILDHPLNLFKYIFQIDTLRYFFFLLGPTGFTSLFSPFQLIISAPEFAINLLSNNWNMRNIIYHYTSVIQPWIFIASVYGAKNILNFFQARPGKRKKDQLFFKVLYVVRQTTYRHQLLAPSILSVYILCCVLSFSYFKSPLPYSREAEIHPYLYPQQNYKEVAQWSKQLQDDHIRVAATNHLSPFFVSRRYFYIFPGHYELADYVVLSKGEVYNNSDTQNDAFGYEKLRKDPNFVRIYANGDLEVYKKVIRLHL